VNLTTIERNELAKGGETTGDFSHVLDGLTEAQASAVTATEGPVLVLAAAGSGKTRVITRRIAHLLSLGVPPWSILALTFTNKAAGEMRERVHQLLADHPDAERLTRGLTVTTFHSLCARLLRRYAPMMEQSGAPSLGITGEYTIYDTADQLALMKKVIPALDLSTENWAPRSMLNTISGLKNEMLDARAFTAQASGFREEKLALIYRAYDKALRNANAVDFDDLLLLTARILNECPGARQEVNSRWQYLMIDEYQDTNLVQFKLSTTLIGTPANVEEDLGIPVDPSAPSAEQTASAPQPNICVVGDPDQSIYGWRGADIANILEFEQVYPGARVIALGQNFRSTAPILDAADTLIRNNKIRKHKDLFTTRQGGEPVGVTLCRDEHHEAELVVDWFKQQTEESEDAEPGDAAPIDWRDMAVLYRNNALSRVLEDGFRKAGVPYVIARGTAFYQREEVKDALSYLRVVANPTDNVSLLRILNKPARKIGKSSIGALDAFASREGLSLMQAMRRAIEIGGVDGVSTIAFKAIGRFVQMIDSWSGAGSFMGSDLPGSLSDLAGRVLKESGLESHYAAVDAKAGDSESAKLDNLQEMVNSALDFENEYDPANDPDRAVFGGGAKAAR